MGASCQVHTWAVGTSGVIHRLQWWEDLRRGRGRGRGDGERESEAVSMPESKRGNAHTARYESQCCLRCLSVHVHSHTSIYILRFCKQSPKLLMSEAAFKAHITFSNIERIKEGKTK